MPVCLFAQPKEVSCQNLQAIPVAELVKSFGTSQLWPPKALAASATGFSAGLFPSCGTRVLPPKKIEKTASHVSG